MQAGQFVFPKRQQGISLTALILVLAVIGLFAVLVIKVVPSYIEYRNITNGMNRAKEAGGTVAEIQRTFDKFAEINDIDAVHGRDLVITRDTGTPEVSFAYEKRIPLTEHAALVIDYEGTTSKSGVAAARVE